MTYIHDLSPIFLQLGALNLRWYSVMYILGFTAVWLYYKHLHRKGLLVLNDKQISDLIFWAFVGMIVGARVTYSVIYNPSHFMSDPLSLLAVWEGGLSFHGALIGIITSITLYLRRLKQPILATADLLILPVPFTLMLGRLGNFMNAELVGRIMPENSPICFVFPTVDMACRYPSQLIQASGEGLLLLIILIVAFAKTPLRYQSGRLFGLFLSGYGLLRFAAEYLREPDTQLGFILQGFTMGQLLSVPMIAFGFYLLTRSTYASPFTTTSQR